MNQTHAFRAGAILYSFCREVPGDGVVLLPVNACHDVLFSILKSGSSVRFVDIDPVHFELDYRLVGKLLSSGVPVKAIVHIHTYGRDAAPLTQFSEIKEMHPEIAIVDDCCLCRPDFGASLPSSIDLRLLH